MGILAAPFRLLLLVKQHLARLVPGWVTQSSCSGAVIGWARFTTMVAAVLQRAHGALFPAN